MCGAEGSLATFRRHECSRCSRFRALIRVDSLENRTQRARPDGGSDVAECCWRHTRGSSRRPLSAGTHGAVCRSRNVEGSLSARREEGCGATSTCLVTATDSSPSFPKFVPSGLSEVGPEPLEFQQSSHIRCLLRTSHDKGRLCDGAEVATVPNLPCDRNARPTTRNDAPATRHNRPATQKAIR